MELLPNEVALLVLRHLTLSGTFPKRACLLQLIFVPSFSNSEQVDAGNKGPCVSGHGV